MNKLVMDIIEHMPYEVYSNKYYKSRYLNQEVPYYVWEYDTKSKYYDYQIKLFDLGNYLNIYAYCNDSVLPIRQMPKTIANTLNDIVNYLNILGFDVEKRYDYK